METNVGTAAYCGANAPHRFALETARIRFSNSHVVRARSFAISPLVSREAWPARSALSYKRAQGMPGARCARSRAWCVESTRVSHHGHTGNTRHSPRNGFTAYNVISPVTGLSCHRRMRISACRAHKGRHRLSAHLTPASGRQDHTTSPSASAPFVKGAARVHRIPRPHS